MADKLVCPICGEPTYLVYGKNPRKDRLCKKHGDMANFKQIEQCPNCGKWINTGDTCQCKQVTLTTSTPEVKQTLNCLICGSDTNGYHFCKACYAKYKDHAIDIRIKNCTEVQILDEYGNKQYKCMNNVLVRSRAEAMICDWLFAHNIRVVYEPDFFYKEDGETKALHPDFYLHDFKVYIEYCELKGDKYLKKKAYTQKSMKTTAQKSL